MFFVRPARLFAALLALSLTACSGSAATRTPSSVGPQDFAVDRLRAKGVSEPFIDLILSQYKEDQRAKVLDLNLLGFLKKRPPLEPRIPRWELAKVQAYLNANARTFRDAERLFAVPREVIASLLWTETRFGKDTGTFHVASSFFSLAQADYPTLYDQILDKARELNGGNLTPEIEKRIADRAKTRAEWAASELVALQEIHQKKSYDARKLKGSFSGAFGIAQFVPSSYLSWARGKKDVADLFKDGDAILSVANYLHVQGFRRNDTEKQKAALFHYNRDENYVNRILRMGGCLREDRKNKGPGKGRWC